MNKLIKELAEQVGFKPYYDIGTGEVDSNGQCITLPNWSSTDPSISMVQKFAELIVQECAKLHADKLEKRPCSEYNKGRIELAQEIKQHFGIK